MKYLKKFDNHTQYEEARQNLILPNVSLCAQENEVYYNPYVKPYIDGHEYVDLGLPSGTKWATMNVGATSETDYGLYFQWGDTQGYTATQCGSGEGQKYFDWEDYKYCSGAGTSNSAMTKYNSTDDKAVLDLEDDAVAANWGGSWKMPTEAQMQELAANTTYEWVTNYKGSGINGGTFTATNGAVLFFPATGWLLKGRLRNVGNYGNNWSSSTYGGDTAYYLYFYNSYKDVRNNGRHYGSPVRGVVG